MDHCQIQEVADIGKTYQLLEKAGLKDGTEALIMTAQEQDLNTVDIYHTRQDPRYRLCKDTPETVQPITAGWKILAGKACIKQSGSRHNAQKHLCRV